ncbi:3-hydroxyacyl-CoA dehydrogenase [Venturia nashicola]|uniref:3-hydroxyacyl-CoA dehydrogenase n=1 Tax=Venturia nashicola TaxID=86259 RepID=A0A4Z1P3P8_9PEZI|nr:3-hydroxyacyl-CoA dehydrogenase [Venturia nashicola]
MSSEEGNGVFKDESSRITLVGAGTIGLSFAALHLQYLTSASQLTIHDTRPDLQSYVSANLPKYLPPNQHALVSQISLSNTKDTFPDALRSATIIQEQGPENIPFKTKIWQEIEPHASKDALLWSSTSGIPASIQSSLMNDKTRLLVVHPYNPPHIMPLLEIVPSPSTTPSLISRTLDFWRKRGRKPVVIHKECTGFVANRLAFALLKEAIHLVDEGVVSVAEIDEIVQASMGPRWAVAGPFKSYHAGGGVGGLEGFFGNIGGTVQGCWDESGNPRYGEGERWEKKVFEQAREGYGVVDVGERDRVTRRVVEAVREEKGE